MNFIEFLNLKPAKTMALEFIGMLKEALPFSEKSKISTVFLSGYDSKTPLVLHRINCGTECIRRPDCGKIENGSTKCHCADEFVKKDVPSLVADMNQNNLYAKICGMGIFVENGTLCVNAQIYTQKRSQPSRISGIPAHNHPCNKCNKNRRCSETEFSCTALQNYRLSRKSKTAMEHGAIMRGE